MAGKSKALTWLCSLHLQITANATAICHHLNTTRGGKNSPLCAIASKLEVLDLILACSHVHAIHVVAHWNNSGRLLMPAVLPSSAKGNLKITKLDAF